jgi:hypothetical protein
MLLSEVILPLDEKQVWARTGKKIVRKYRCAGGRRNGRVVSSMSQCYAAPNLKRSLQLKKTKARRGNQMMRKARRTKKLNPASKRIQTLNKSKRR